jgi:3-methyl-2-oxobutanoate hydroxymethyltransferase
LQEANMDAVKLEGGRERAETIRKIVEAGIPVMGHIGLTPQSVQQLGGFRAQGKLAASAQRLVEDALILEEAGCFSLVLESIPARLAALDLTKGQHCDHWHRRGQACDGQVLVLHDMLGLFDRFRPKFVKTYANLHTSILEALQTYRSEVEDGVFPAAGTHG